MAELTVQYTAPLPPGFTTGVLELKYPRVYLDDAGRKSQPFYRATIGADRSLTDVQTGLPLKIIAADDGDPAPPEIDWVESLTVAGQPEPLRQTRRIPANRTAAGVLNLHQPDPNAPLVGSPNSASLVAATAAANANAAAASVNAAVLNLAGERAAVQQTLAAAALDRAATAQAIGLIPAPSLTAIPATPGFYRVVGTPNSGEVYERLGNGTLERRVRLEPPRPEIPVEDYGMYPDQDPTATSAALQALLDAIPSGVTVRFKDGANYNLNATPYLEGRSRVRLLGRGTTWTYTTTAALQCGIVVSAVPLDRTLTGGAWGRQFLTHRFDTVTPVQDVTLEGLTLRTTDGSNRATYPLLYFADDSGLRDVTVNNSNGSGVEWRQCARPWFDGLTIGRAGTYGIFGYQVHALRGRRFTQLSGGRAVILKEGHAKYVGTQVPHIIDGFEVRDLVGFPAVGQADQNPVWVSGGISINDLQLLVDAGTAGYTQAMADARNFPGHERVPPLVLRNGAMRLTSAAPVNAATPQWVPGCFADGWRLENVELVSDGREMTGPAVVLGSTGSIDLGKSLGGAFGRDHVLDGVTFRNFSTVSSGNSLVQYGVPFTLRGCRTENVNVKRVLHQPDAPAGKTADFYLPFGTVDTVETTGNTLTWTQPLAYQGQFGVQIGNAATPVGKWITGGNTWTCTPVDNGSETVHSPVYVRATRIEPRGEDTINVPANPASVNHAVTYGVTVEATQGELPRLNSVLGTPTKTTGQSVRALWQYKPAGTDTTDRMVYRPGRHTLNGTPSGEKFFARLEREVVKIGTAALTGAFQTSESDATGLGNAQNLRRVLYAAAVPTTGTYQSGDVIWRLGPTLGMFQGWECRQTGTYGTATEPIWEPFGQVGYRVAGGRPASNAQYAGERQWDSVSKLWWQAVTAGNGAADWVAGSVARGITKTWAPGAIAAGATVTTTFTASASVVGDFVLVSAEGGVEAGLVMDAFVSAANTVTVRLTNFTAGSITPASRVYAVSVLPR